MESIPRQIKLKMIQETDGLDLLKMDRSMLIDYTKRANQYANMRLGHLYGQYKDTPATQMLKRELGPDKIKWKDIEKMSMNQLRHTFATYKKFLNSQTSTKKGEQERRKKFIATMTKGRELTPEETKKVEELFNAKDFWEIVDKIREADPSLEFILGSPTFIEKIKEHYTDMSFDELLEYMQNKSGNILSNRIDNINFDDEWI